MAAASSAFFARLNPETPKTRSLSPLLCKGESIASARFTQRELAKAFRAAKSEGIDVQIKIARDGTLTINPLAGDTSAAWYREVDTVIGEKRVDAAIEMARVSALSLKRAAFLS